MVMQNGPRGRREQEFYELIMAILQSEECYHPRRRLSGSCGEWLIIMLFDCLGCL